MAEGRPRGHPRTGAFLATVATRLAISTARSARVWREAYVGPWLPEPVDTSADPQLGAERAEAVEMAVLLLLERLNPVERAAYVLREAFDYSYRQVAAILETSEGNARQLVSLARKHLATERREQVSRGEHQRLLEVFLTAAQTGDLLTLEEVLAADVVSYADGGGIRGLPGSRWSDARTSPSTSPPSRRACGRGAQVRWVEANDRPDVLVHSDGKAVALLSIDASAQGIDRLMRVTNPGKLASYAASSSC